MAPELNLETKEAVFDRLAVARTNKALKSIRLLENLKHYPHNAKKSQRIVNALKAATEKVEYALGGDDGVKTKDEFSLDDD